MTSLTREQLPLYEIVYKLVGPIQPIGETQEDDKRFENLKAFTALVDSLLTDIDDLVRYKERCEYSMKRSGEYANKFLERIGINE